MREDITINFIFQRMSADYINIQSEKDKLAEDNARLMEQLNKMRHRNVFGYRTKLFCSSIPMYDCVWKPIKSEQLRHAIVSDAGFSKPEEIADRYCE